MHVAKIHLVWMLEITRVGPLLVRVRPLGRIRIRGRLVEAFMYVALDSTRAELLAP